VLEKEEEGEGEGTVEGEGDELFSLLLQADRARHSRKERTKEMTCFVFFICILLSYHNRITDIG